MRKYNIKAILENAQQSWCKNLLPVLDGELLLAEVLGVTRSYLYAHPERALTPTEWRLWQRLWRRRLKGEPVAYILGRKEFWSFSFKVNRNVLIPRPETELLVELALAKFPAQQAVRFVDLGTGSGAVAVSIAKERPLWRGVATDRSRRALRVARDNAAELQCTNVEFLCGSWLKALPKKELFDLIISNPPYVAKNERATLAKELSFEPKRALFAGKDGLDDLRVIIAEAPQHLVNGGVLMLEHGADQSAAVVKLMQKYGYHNVSSHADLAGKMRVTVGGSARSEK